MDHRCFPPYKALAGMICLIVLFLASLIVGIAYDTALDTRLAYTAVEQAERLIEDEYLALSIVELAAREIQLDPVRSRDAPDDSWAGDFLPRMSPYEWISNATIEARIEDLERYPSRRILMVVNAVEAFHDFMPAHDTRSRWLNVLTAERASWRARFR